VRDSQKTTDEEIRESVPDEHAEVPHKWSSGIADLQTEQAGNIDVLKK
jgi:hypothetical protein